MLMDMEASSFSISDGHMTVSQLSTRLTGCLVKKSPIWHKRSSCSKQGGVCVCVCV